MAPARRKRARARGTHRCRWDFCLGRRPCLGLAPRTERDSSSRSNRSSDGRGSSALASITPLVCCALRRPDGTAAPARPAPAWPLACSLLRPHLCSLLSDSSVSPCPSLSLSSRAFPYCVSAAPAPAGRGADRHRRVHRWRVGRSPDGHLQPARSAALCRRHRLHGDEVHL
jgi:hypothetical protein